MKRYLARVLALSLALVAAAAAARGQGASGVHFGLFGGASLPMDETKDVFDDGWHGGAMLAINAPVAPIGLRIEGIYSQMDREEILAGVTGELKILGAAANLVLGPRTPVVRPYFIGGAGYYRLEFDTRSDLFDFEDEENNFGWNAGAGISFSLGGVHLFVEGRYHSISIDEIAGDEDAPDVKIVPVSVGLVF
jgi:opacity protein-like surface antigen